VPQFRLGSYGLIQAYVLAGFDVTLAIDAGLASAAPLALDLSDVIMGLTTPVGAAQPRLRPEGPYSLDISGR